MAGDLGYAWCPECKKWVPDHLMNYDRDEETGNMTRVCTPCLEGTSHLNNYVYEEHHEEIQCIYCGAYGCKELKDRKHYFECPECKETFWRY